jgi:hypothetical protein
MCGLPFTAGRYTFRQTYFMKKYVYCLLCLAVSSCYLQQPITREPPQNNATYTVDYLFEHEGCKVYRFYDRGNYIYFTNCNGEAIMKTDSTAIRNSTRVEKNSGN